MYAWNNDMDLQQPDIHTHGSSGDFREMKMKMKMKQNSCYGGDKSLMIW